MHPRVFFRARKNPNGTFSARAKEGELEVFNAKDQRDCLLKCMAVARMSSLRRVDVVVDFPQELPT